MFTRSCKTRLSRKFRRHLFTRCCVANVSLSWATVTHKQQCGCIFISAAEVGELQAILLNFALTSFYRSGLATIFCTWPRGRNKLQKELNLNVYLCLSSILNRFNDLLMAGLLFSVGHWMEFLAGGSYCRIANVYNFSGLIFTHASIFVIVSAQSQVKSES